MSNEKTDLSAAAAKLKRARKRGSSPAQQTEQDETSRAKHKERGEDGGGLIGNLVGMAQRLKRD